MVRRDTLRRRLQADSRQLDHDQRPPRRAVNRQRRAIAEGQRQALAAAGQAVISGIGVPASNPGPSSSTSIRTTADGRGGADRERPPLAARRDRVLHAVLHERLERQAAAPALPRAPSIVDTEAEALAEPHALDIQVVAYHLELLFERDERAAALSSDERISEASCPVIRSAPSGSRGISDAMEFSVLNRKWGCTRDSSDASCASLASAAGLGLVALLRPQRERRLLEVGANELVDRDSASRRGAR